MTCKIRCVFFVPSITLMTLTTFLHPRQRPVDNAELPFVIIIPSYNNRNWYEANLNSALGQNYENFRVIFIDDCSPDETGALAEEYLKNHPRRNKITLIKNKKRHLKMANLYQAVWQCRNNEIVVELDGDDWYAHKNVLRTLNNIYQSGEVWLTYGSHKKYPESERYPACTPTQKLPHWVIEQNAFRSVKEAAIQVQLRTFRAALFKQLPLEDFFYEGRFVPTSADTTIMLPMYELAGERFRLVDKPLYVHNIKTELNDHKVAPILQFDVDGYIRRRPKYGRMEQLKRVSAPSLVTCDIIIPWQKTNSSAETILRIINRDFRSVGKIFTYNLIQGGNCYHVDADNLIESLLLSPAPYFIFLPERGPMGSQVSLETKITTCHEVHASGYNLTVRKNDLKSSHIAYEKIHTNVYAYQVNKNNAATNNIAGCVLNKGLIGVGHRSCLTSGDLANILDLTGRVILFDK